MKTLTKNSFKNSKKNETGTKEEKIDLRNQVSENNKTDSDMMLPHERDETTGPTGTNEKGNEKSREVIKRAHDDTEHGLKDTDRHGIPSDIESCDSEKPAITKNIRKSEEKEG
ncbi:hypothetical protein [Nitrosomonas ureae]|uniref:Uncharacterized protein n=1 Tax=Nitrosomonas ureae TaxID=44577 RepID=A0A286A4M5_9PROT|nr:hypothetical protein [Nitrosomonas ureae]SOD16874.1 hypothetical protein SAMN06297164_0825 [Nitrosomonas ureae]